MKAHDTKKTQKKKKNNPKIKLVPNLDLVNNATDHMSKRNSYSFFIIFMTLLYTFKKYKQGLCKDVKVQISKNQKEKEKEKEKEKKRY